MPNFVLGRNSTVRFRFAMPLTLCLAVLVLMIAGAQGHDPPAKDDMCVLVSLRGAHSRIIKPTYLCARTAEEFRDIYMRHLGEEPADFDEHYNPHGVPEIDFERCMVVAIFKGEGHNNAGVFVHSVTADHNRLLVRFDNHYYQTAGDFNSGDGGAQRVTAYGIFVLPRSDKQIVLEENVQNIIGDPPVWKEKARFEAIK